jgi:branched-chain amino acid transport system ATP-binding protein
VTLSPQVSPGHTSKAFALELSQVEAGYGESTVLRGLDLRVPKGSVVALLGANGAGKTTALRVAAGLLSPSSGHVYLDGSDVTRSRPTERAVGGVCLIPEGRGIYPSLTVRENLKLFTPKGSQSHKIEDALLAFPALGQRLGYLAGSLSGGEQQMLALTRAYLSSPKIILLDEVSMGLAPLVVAQIFASMIELAKAGTSLLIVEQYVGMALKVADHVYLLKRGQVAWSGAAEDVNEALVLSSYLGDGEIG